MHSKRRRRRRDAGTFQCREHPTQRRLPQPRHPDPSFEDKRCDGARPTHTHTHTVSRRQVADRSSGDGIPATRINPIHRNGSSPTPTPPHPYPPPSDDWSHIPPTLPEFSDCLCRFSSIFGSPSHRDVPSYSDSILVCSHPTSNLTSEFRSFRSFSFGEVTVCSTCHRLLSSL